MTKRIFRSIFLVALVVLLLSVALLSVVFYNDYAVQYRSELKSEALSMAHAINGGLAEEDYLRSLEQDKISPIRITWIGADGAVRYDNKADPAQMGNHAARTAAFGVFGRMRFAGFSRSSAWQESHVTPAEQASAARTEMMSSQPSNT